MRASRALPEIDGAQIELVLGTPMQDILVLGAGKIGALICGLLAESGDYRVQLADKAEGAADEVASFW